MVSRDGQENRRWDSSQLLQDIEAEKVTPVEIIPRLINHPDLDEEGCKVAGSILKGWAEWDRPQSPQSILNDLDALAKRWQGKHPSLENKLGTWQRLQNELSQTTQERKSAEQKLGAIGRPLHWLFFVLGPLAVVLLAVKYMLIPSFALGKFRFFSASGDPLVWLLILLVMMLALAVTIIVLESSYRKDKAPLEKELKESQEKVNRVVTGSTQAWTELRQEVKNVTEQELGGGLVGDSHPRAPYWGDWYVKYALVPETSAFQKFFAEDASLSAIMHTEGVDVPAVRRQFVGAITEALSGLVDIMGTNGASPGVRSYARVLIISDAENLNAFAPSREELRQAFDQNVVDVDIWLEPKPQFKLRVLALCLRSPAHQWDLGRARQYADVIESRSGRSPSRDPEPLSGELRQILGRKPNASHRSEVRN